MLTADAHQFFVREEQCRMSVELNLRGVLEWDHLSFEVLSPSDRPCCCPRRCQPHCHSHPHLLSSLLPLPTLPLLPTLPSVPY